MFSPLHFSPMVTNCFFSFHSLHLSHLFIFSPTPQLPSFLSTKLLTSLLLPSTIWLLSPKSPHLKLSPRPSSLIFSMVPNSKKTSYMISSNAFNLTHWNWAVRLNESLSLTYRPQDHLLKGVRIGLVSFSKFSHFLIFFWSFVLIYFWTCKFLGFVVGWV